MKLEIDLGGLRLKNPVLTASGTFGYGEEFSDFIELGKLGGFLTKGLTLFNREGNPYPRMAETPSGMLNAVGLQNKGIEYFKTNILPRIKDCNTNIIANINGSTVEDYVALAEIVNEIDEIPAIELNISCPNVKEGGMAFGVRRESAIKVTKAVREVYKKHIMVKLSPNVTDIAMMAKAVEGEGADSISLINTLLGMGIDAETQKPELATITGGLSGPAVKPIALRMVWQVFNAVKVPVVGMGGIMNASDAIEFMLAGASAIQVGTANFIDPQISVKIIEGIKDYCERHKIDDVNDLVGALKV